MPIPFVLENGTTVDPSHVLAYRISAPTNHWVVPMATNITRLSRHWKTLSTLRKMWPCPATLLRRTTFSQQGIRRGFSWAAATLAAALLGSAPETLRLSMQAGLPVAQ